MKHSAKIADVLEDLAKIPQVTSAIVKEKLFNILSAEHGAFQIKPGVAKEIADEVVGVINKLFL